MPTKRVAQSSEEDVISAMHEWMNLLSDTVMVVATVCVFIVAPLAKSLRACFWISTLPMALWSALRLFIIIWFKENSPPMMGFVVVPLFAFGYATALRTLVNGVKWLWRKANAR